MSATLKALSLLLLCFSLRGATYYVSSSAGSNSNSGTDSGHPWQTVGKMSAPGITYQPDDFILFKCGDTWQGSPDFTASLTTPNAGTSGHQITYGNYGACTGSNKPVLDGNSTIGTLINISKSWITINGLKLQNASAANTVGQLISFSTAGTQIRNVDGKNAGFRGFSGNVGAAVGPITIDGNTFTVDPGHTIGNAIFIIQTTPTNNSSPITFTHNTCDLRGTLNSSALCVNIQGSSVVTIQYNTAYNTAQAWAIKPAGGIACTGTQSVTGGLIADNYSENIQGGVGDGENIELQGCATFPQSGVTVTRNVIVCGHDPNTGSLDAIGIFYSQGNFIYDNVLIGPCGPGKTGTTPRLIHASSSSSGNFYYHNVISGGTGASGHRGIIFGSGSSSNADFIKNNIFDNLSVGVENDGSGHPVEDGNIFNTNVAAVSSGTSLTHGTGSSQISTNPWFAHTPLAFANDAKLEPTSPAIGAGINLGSPYNLILNPLGTAVPYGTYDQSSAWMIGAFGFTSGITQSISGATISGAMIP
jgi:hypothetical protein